MTIESDLSSEIQNIMTSIQINKQVEHLIPQIETNDKDQEEIELLNDLYKHLSHNSTILPSPVLYDSTDLTKKETSVVTPQWSEVDSKEKRNVKIPKISFKNTNISQSTLSNNKLTASIATKNQSKDVNIRLIPKPKSVENSISKLEILFKDMKKEVIHKYFFFFFFFGVNG